MRRLLLWFDARSCAAINSTALLLLILISAIDYVTPAQISTFVFYVAPIGVAAWFGGRVSGQVFALLSAGAWMAKDVVFRGLPYTDPPILFWNTVARLVTFSLVAWLITDVRLHLRREERLARTDPLTGLLNARTFREALKTELTRAGRAGYPVSFVYVDLDNFKSLNDRLGHAEGDRALAIVAELFRSRLRQNDVIGRLGGDEFAVILPATDAGHAKSVVSLLQAGLNAEMERHGWPITLSIGAVTCRTRCDEPDALVQAADRLMYEAKTGGKNAFLHRMWHAEGSEARVKRTRA